MRGITRSARVLAAASVLVIAAFTSGSAAGPRPATVLAAAAGAAPAALASPSDTGASDITSLGRAGWRVLSSASTTATGAQISTPGFGTSGWLPVSNDDAGAPGTEVEALAQNGLCPGDTALQPVNQGTGGPNSVFFSNNIQLCYGYMNTVGPDTVKLFSVPWWWRTDFTASPAPGQVAAELAVTSG